MDPMIELALAAGAFAGLVVGAKTHPLLGLVIGAEMLQWATW